MFAKAHSNARSALLKPDVIYAIHSRTNYSSGQDVAIVSAKGSSFRFMVPMVDLVLETKKPEPRRISPEHAQRQRDLKRDLVLHLTTAAVNRAGHTSLSNDAIDGIFNLAYEISERF